MRGSPDRGGLIARVLRPLGRKRKFQVAERPVLGLFMDAASLPQKDYTGHRSVEDTDKFGRGLGLMGKFYGSASTAVIYPTRTWGPKEKSNLRHHLSREASDQAAHQDGATVMRERGEGDGG